jgi:hypothetical protein
VIGPGIIKFFIADVPGLSDPVARARRLVVFAALRKDGLVVRMQPHRTQGTRVLWVDPPGPWYFGHLARIAVPTRHQTIDGRRLLPGVRTLNDMYHSQVYATADGLEFLYDKVTNAQAQAFLADLNLPPGSEVDLSSGTKFPWALWVHHQGHIMQAIKLSGGITRFTAVAFQFVLGETGTPRRPIVNTQAFRIDLPDPADSLLIFPFPEKSVIATITNAEDAHDTCSGNTELQETLAKRCRRGELVEATGACPESDL